MMDCKKHSQNPETADKLVEMFVLNANVDVIAKSALSFMHCKNVKYIENDPMSEMPKRVRQHWTKKNHEPLTKHYTLDIQPVKEVLRNEGSIEHNGIRKAMHICRGHFKDYSKGNGLFGKFKGLYWWDMSVRGNSGNGKIIKDYNIKV